jgi:hypothetical protein
MAKKIEDMTLTEVLDEFEAKPKYRMPKRRKNLVLLTLRVPQDVKKRLSDEARKRGSSGYTAMARELIERGLRAGDAPNEAIVAKIAKATADQVVSSLRRRHAV